MGDAVGVGDNRPIVIDCADVNVDVNEDLVMEVQCPSLVKSLHRMLLASCETARVVAPRFA